MKKKVLALVLVLVLALGLSLPAFAEDEAEEFVINSFGVLTAYNGPGGDVVIPDRVTYIETGVFTGNEAITSVTFPAGMTQIEVDLSGCSNLTRVVFSSVPEYLWMNCRDTKMTELTIPEGVQRGSVFSNVLTRLNLPTTAKEFGVGVNADTEICNAFGGSMPYHKYNEMPNNKLLDWLQTGKEADIWVDDFIIVDGVLKKYKGTDADVVVPDGVVEVGMQAFVGYENGDQITSITFPTSVVKLNEVCCYGLANVRDIVLPASIASIHDNAFGVFGNDYIHGFSGRVRFHVAPGTYAEAWVNAHAWGNWSTVVDQPVPVAQEGQTWGVVFKMNDGRSIEWDEEKYILVTNGGTYGELPVPTTAWQGNATFTGWYTEPEGGEEITADTRVWLNGGQVLYAHWGGTKVKTMAYSFINSRGGFGYSGGYRIGLEKYQMIYGDTEDARQRFLHQGAWGGNCYGMSTTAAMFDQEGSGSVVTDFDKNARQPYDLSVSARNEDWGMTLRDYIEAMQISQFRLELSQNAGKHWNDLDALCREVERYRATGEGPVLICIYGSGGGHAVVGYDLVPVSATETRLLVYDPNYSQQERYITLTMDGDNCISWYYHLNDVWNWGTGYPYNGISYTDYKIYEEVWQGRSKLQAQTLLYLDRDAAILDQNGETVAAVKDGELITDRKDVYKVTPIGVTADNVNGGPEGTAVWLPSDVYTISASGELNATLVHVDQSTTVTSSTGTVRFAVDDAADVSYVQVPTGSHYTMELNSTKKTGSEAVRLVGTALNEPAALAQVEGKLYGTGAKSATLEVNGVSTPVSTLSSEMPDVARKIAGKIAYSTAYPISVDGKEVSFDAYALKDENGNDTNYVKLRDLAYVLDGTAARFQVGWDQETRTISITTGKSYTPDGSEMSVPFVGNQYYAESPSRLLVNGREVSLSAILLTDNSDKGYTYFKLRDLGEALGFNVGWSRDRGMFIESGKPYDPNN